MSSKARKNQLLEALQENDALKSALRKANEREASALNEMASAKEAEKIARDQFDDLKTRLHAAETVNQFMRGYLARVKEDDQVREELLTIGEPGGEQQIVPKRKSTDFPQPSNYEPNAVIGGVDRQVFDGGYGSRAFNPRHWITY